MANISVSNITLSAIVSVTVSVSSYSASASYQDVVYSTDGASVSYSYEIIETRPLPSESITPFDLPELTVNTFSSDDVTISESDVKEVNISPEDSVVVTESQFKIITNPIDFDPTDDDVDPTPVTISESDAKDITVGELADNDETSVTEASAKTATKPGITASVSTSEAIDDFDVGKNVADTATASEAIDQFDVTTQLSDTVSITEAAAKTITPDGKTDSVTMSGDNIKAINSSVDFDPSDADVDPDPITATDAVNAFEPSLGKTESLNIAESNAKDFTRPNITDAATASDSPALNPEIPASDSVSAVEGIKNNPSLAKTETITSSDSINKFDPRLTKTDSITSSDSLDEFDIDLVKSDSVSITDVSVRNYTQEVDFDTSDADADADPVSITEILAANPTKILSESFSPSESQVFSFTTIRSDSLTISESIVTNLTLGSYSAFYPGFVYASDGDDSAFIRGYHRGLYETSGNIKRAVEPDGFLVNVNLVNEKVVNGDITYIEDPQEIRGFVQSPYRFRIADTSGVLGQGDSLLNSAPVWEITSDGIGHTEPSGVIGHAELVNMAVINADTITYGDLTNAGLVVNFMYTDTDDTTLGGHYLNETPLSAGSYS